MNLGHLSYSNGYMNQWKNDNTNEVVRSLDSCQSRSTKRSRCSTNVNKSFVRNQTYDKYDYIDTISVNNVFTNIILKSRKKPGSTKK